MKADNLRFVYECLDGDNGLFYDNEGEGNHSLGQDRTVYDFSVFNERDDNKKCGWYNETLTKEVYEPEDVQCDLCANFYEEQNMTLLEFFEHEVNHEYEKAMRCIYKDLSFKGGSLPAPIELARDPIKNANESSKFHPVFYSSLLN